MRIGINILYLIPGRVGGTETYARELIPYLAKKHELIIFCGREAAPTFSGPNIQVVTLPIYSESRAMRLLAEQTILPILCITKKIDVLFSLGYSAPFIHPCPSVVTIHDLNWYYHPEDFTWLERTIWQFLVRGSAKFSNHIITDSAFSADSIQKILGIKKSKVTSILHGVPKIINTMPTDLGYPYLFTVMADYPHKNFSTLLQVFAQLKLKFPTLHLVVCGLGRKIVDHKENVKILGYVTRAELASLYRGAKVFVFPSAYEGFGYPVLEAMSYGTPVVSSSSSSLTEVVGDGGILVESYAVAQYVKAISQLLDSESLRNKMIAKGNKRVSELKWSDTATKTLEIL